MRVLGLAEADSVRLPGPDIDLPVFRRQLDPVRQVRFGVLVSHVAGQPFERAGQPAEGTTGAFRYAAI